MTERITVFVNQRPVDLPHGADVAEAVQAADPALSEKLAAGAAYVTDGRGVEIESGVHLAAGSILRVIVRARKGSTDADA
jgi:hypothetical protein